MKESRKVELFASVLPALGGDMERTPFMLFIYFTAQALNGFRHSSKVLLTMVRHSKSSHR